MIYDSQLHPVKRVQAVADQGTFGAAAELAKTWRAIGSSSQMAADMTKTARALGSSAQPAADLVESLRGPGSLYFNATRMAETLRGPGSLYFNATRMAETLGGSNGRVAHSASAARSLDQFNRSLFDQSPLYQLNRAIATPTAEQIRIGVLSSSGLPRALAALSSFDQLAKVITAVSPIGQERLGIGVATYSQLAKAIAGLTPIDQVGLGIGAATHSQFSQVMPGFPGQFSTSPFGIIWTGNKAGEPADGSIEGSGVSDARFVIVHDPETANALLTWLTDREAAVRRAVHVCDTLALLHALMVFAQYRLALDVSPAVEGLEAGSELFFAFMAFLLHWIS